MHLQTQTNIWQPFLQAVERRLGKQAVATWFQPLRVSGASTPEVLVIAAPNIVVRDWIVSNYANVLSESLKEIALHSCRIQWSVLPSHDPVVDAATGILEPRSSENIFRKPAAASEAPKSEKRQTT